jgi:uncharacterized protein YbjT (DUF2867 family)
MTFVIHGATGAQGAPLFARLLKAGNRAVAAVRNTGAANNMPAVAIDNASVDSLAAAYRDADGVFVHLPMALWKRTASNTRITSLAPLD